VLAPLLLGLVMILLLNRAGPDRRRDGAAIALGVVSLTFSGVSVPLLAAAGVLVAFRRSVRDAARIVAAPATVYLLWLSLAGRSGVGHQVAAGRLLEVPAFAWAGL